MVALGGYSERKPELEQKLARHYYDSLLAHGVKNYAWDDCWNDYRWAAIRNLNVPVIQWLKGRNPELWQSNLNRAMAAYEDLGCSELLNK